MDRLALLFLFALACASAPSAQAGFSVGGGLYGAGLSVEDDGDNETDSGAGLAVDLAYGFTPSVAVFLTLGGASMEPEDGGEGYTLGSADLGARFGLRPSSALNPYLQVALHGQSAVFDVPGTSADLEVSGAGLTLGGGLLYAFSPSVALDVSLDLTGGQFSEISLDGESTDNFEAIDTALARLGVGVVFRP